MTSRDYFGSMSRHNFGKVTQNKRKLLKSDKATKLDSMYQVSQKMSVYMLSYLLENGHFFGTPCTIPQIKTVGLSHLRGAIYQSQ